MAALPWLGKAGARLVSQPPTPWAEPQPVMDDNLMIGSESGKGGKTKAPAGARVT